MNVNIVKRNWANRRHPWLHFYRIWSGPCWRCGREAGGQTPPQTGPHILYASWLTIKTVRINQLCCREAPWSLHIQFPSGWHLQVVDSDSMKQRFRIQPQVPNLQSLTRWLSHGFERLCLSEEACGKWDLICRWVKVLFLKNMCIRECLERSGEGAWILQEEKTPLCQEFHRKHQFRKWANPPWQCVVTTALQRKRITHKYNFRNQRSHNLAA